MHFLIPAREHPYVDRLVRKEKWILSLDPTNLDRSYLFGRLLALAEQVERSSYTRGEIYRLRSDRLRPFFLRRPYEAWNVLYRALPNRFMRLSPGMRAFYYYMIQDITTVLPYPDDPTLNLPLDEGNYLCGYNEQRAALCADQPVLAGVIRHNL